MSVNHNDIELTGVSVRYSLDREVLSDITMSFPFGRCTLLIGPNGSGKSTLLKAIAGLVNIDRGAVLFDDKNLSKLSPKKVFDAGIAYLPADNRIFPALTVRENLDVSLAGLKKRARDQKIQSLYSAFPWIEEAKGRLAANLSGGQQQMLSLNRAISAGATFLLLDEPSSGLDARAASLIGAELSRLISQGNMSFIIAEHNIGWAMDICESFVALKEGKIYRTGACDSSKDDPELIRDVFL